LALFRKAGCSVPSGDNIISDVTLYIIWDVCWNQCRRRGHAESSRFVWHSIVRASSFRTSLTFMNSRMARSCRNHVLRSLAVQSFEIEYCFFEGFAFIALPRLEVLCGEIKRPLLQFDGFGIVQQHFELERDNIGTIQIAVFRPKCQPSPSSQAHQSRARDEGQRRSLGSSDSDSEILWRLSKEEQNLFNSAGTIIRDI
jgi:hypothetical protein